MAWNRSSSSETIQDNTRKPRLLSSGFVIVIFLIVCIALYFSLFPSKEVLGEKTPIPNNRIHETAPSTVTSRVERTQIVSGKPAEPTEDEILLKGRDTNKWIVVTNPRTGKKFVSKLLTPGRNLPPPLYKNNSLNVLDAIMFTDQSDPMFGVEVNKGFMKGIQSALIDGVEITEEDSPDHRERKQAMKELLSDFKKRLKDGEDISATIEEALRERRNIYAFKQMISQTRKEMRESGASEDEIADFERACNKKLEEKGASPIRTMEGFMKSVEKRRLQKEGQK